MFKAVGFDLDGTFVNTHVDYPKLRMSDRRICEAHGIPFDDIYDDEPIRRRADLREWLIANGRGDEFDAIDKEIDDECTRCELEYADDAVLFPGSRECLGIIRSKGLKIGLLTRGSFEYGSTILTMMGVIDMFDTIVGRDYRSYDDAKPSPVAMRDFAKELGVEPEEILYVGDNLTDYFSARDAGATFMGVTSGHVPEEQWLEQDPMMMVKAHASDVVDLL